MLNSGDNIVLFSGGRGVINIKPCHYKAQERDTYRKGSIANNRKMQIVYTCMIDMWISSIYRHGLLIYFYFITFYRRL